MPIKPEKTTMLWFNGIWCWITWVANLSHARAKESSLPLPNQGKKDTSRSFTELVAELEAIIETGDREKAGQQLRALHKQYVVPMIELLPKEIWGTDTDQLVLKTHSVLNIEEAVLNTQVTSRQLTEEEIKYLELLVTHWCGWSPTSADHRDDSWVWYLRYTYPSLIGLYFILDMLI